MEMKSKSAESFSSLRRFWTRLTNWLYSNRTILILSGKRSRRKWQSKMSLSAPILILTSSKEAFVRNYFDEDVESNVIPILLDEKKLMPFLRDKSLYIGIAMWNKNDKKQKHFAIIEFLRVQLEDLLFCLHQWEKNVILLEDVIIENLPYIFSYFGYDEFSAHCFKVTKDAEFDLDNDVRTSFVEKIEKGLKNRRKGKPTRFVFDKNMDPQLLEFLTKKNLTKKDSIIPGEKSTILNIYGFSGCF
jgi:polyphosphate kinase